MEVKESNNSLERLSFEDALNKSGFGKYNFSMLLVCCLLIFAMYIDIFGFSVVLPSVACDMDLSTSQQGLLSAMPLIAGLIVAFFLPRDYSKKDTEGLEKK